MKKLFYLSLTLFFLLLGTSAAKATHIVGGEVYYDSLGGGRYKITIEVFRDCGPLSSGFDLFLEYTIFTDDGTQWSTRTVEPSIITQLPVIYDDPCVTPPDDICIERAIYIDTVILPFDPFQPTGYHISYQRCCWANNITNLVDPAENGITLTDHVTSPDLVTERNQSARFNNYPQLVLCANNSITFDHSATDPDGDSLAYEMITPWLGGDQLNSIPNPETPPPYTPSVWEVGFSGAQPFGPGSSVTIDAVTGEMVFSPDMIGTYVAGVAVKEYRNGVLINTKIRTFGYRVVDCDQEVPLEIETFVNDQPVGASGNVLIEDCGVAGFEITRTDTTTNLVMQMITSGTAINGDDYTAIDDTLIIPHGVFTDTILIAAFLDNVTEGDETVELQLVIKNPCADEYDTTSILLTIVDYTNMSITHTDSANICADFGEITPISCSVSNGVPPYSYYWQPVNMPSNDTVYITPGMVVPNVNNFNVTVTDECGKTIQSDLIQVYNQCPLTVPNVMTTNNDGINDFLVITNLEDFDRVGLKIFNRWGNIIYENDAYKNDWKGTDSDGNQLEEGVYFYMVTPESEKYNYDDNEKSKFTAHGYVQIFVD